MGFRADDQVQHVAVETHHAGDPVVAVRDMPASAARGTPAVHFGRDASQDPRVSISQSLRPRPDDTVGEVQLVRSLDPTFGLDQQAIAAGKKGVSSPAPGIRKSWQEFGRRPISSQCLACSHWWAAPLRRVTNSQMQVRSW